jgi:hypothetical protein
LERLSDAMHAEPNPNARQTSNEQRSAPTPRTPKWVWFLGGGCALALLVGIGAVLFTLRFVSRARDPELQWPKLAAILPFDEQPAGWTLTGLPLSESDGEVFTLRVPDGDEQIVVSHYPAAEAPAFRKAHFEEVELSANAPIIGPVGRFDPVLSKLAVQGRELDVLRYYTTPELAEKPEGLLGAIQEAAATANAAIDLSPDPAGDLIVFEVRRQGERRPISDEDLLRFLAPFRVGPAPSGSKKP